MSTSTVGCSTICVEAKGKHCFTRSDFCPLLSCPIWESDGGDGWFSNLTKSFRFLSRLWQAMCSLENSVILQNYHFCFVFWNNILALGAECREVVLLELVCNGLASVDKSLCDEGLQLILSYPSRIFWGVNMSGIHDVFCVYYYQLFTIFHERITQFLRGSDHFTEVFRKWTVDPGFLLLVSSLFRSGCVASKLFKFVPFLDLQPSISWKLQGFLGVPLHSCRRLWLQH